MPQNWTTEQFSDFLDRIADGWSIRAAGESVGKTRGQAHGIFHRLCLGYGRQSA